MFWPGQEKSFKKFYKCLFSVLAWTGKKVSKIFTSVYLVFWPGQGKKKDICLESMGHWNWFKSMKGWGFEENYVEEYKTENCI